MKTKNKAEVAPAQVDNKLQPPPLTGYDCPCASKGLTDHDPSCLYHASRDIVQAPAQSGQHTPTPELDMIAEGMDIVTEQDTVNELEFKLREITSQRDELLAACHSAANRLECVLAEYAGTQSDKDTLRTVRAAIAKAEGREP